MVFHAFGKEFQLIYLEKFSFLFLCLFLESFQVNVKIEKNYLPKASLKQWPAEVNNSKFGGLKCILAR